MHEHRTRLQASSKQRRAVVQHRKWVAIAWLLLGVAIWVTTWSLTTGVVASLADVISALCLVAVVTIASIGPSQRREAGRAASAQGTDSGDAGGVDVWHHDLDGADADGGGD